MQNNGYDAGAVSASLLITTKRVYPTGHVFYVTNTIEWIEALEGIGRSGHSKSYTITISGLIPVPGNTEWKSSFGDVEDITVTINGSGRLYLSGQGHLLDIRSSSAFSTQTVIIDSSSLTLQGLKAGQNNSIQNNNTPLVGVYDSGKLELKNGTISDNAIYSNQHGGGGVRISRGGVFYMSGGNIIGNSAIDGFGGGGVYVGGNFQMSGGNITGNAHIVINPNKANNGSIIEQYGGGGVHVIRMGMSLGSFVMTGGVINGNTPTFFGGGVYIDSPSGGFEKTGGGIIYGNGAGINSNTAFGGNTYGHAVDNRGTYRDITLNVGDNINASSTMPSISGQTLNGWTRR
jgi:hypothetical protein